MKSKISPYLLLFCLLLLTTCTPQRLEIYPLSNPILVAFKHQLDILAWKDTLEKDPYINLLTVDGGLVLFSDGIGDLYRFWINDSLLVAQLDATYSYPLSGIGDQVIFEAQRRQNNANLVARVSELFSGEVNFRTTSIDDYQTSISDTKPFLIEKEQLYPVDSLIWHSSAFDREVSYRFINGRLEGQFTAIDSSGLVQTGQFQDGAEFGIWKYLDAFGDLQYTEEYALGGELQKVRYEKGATFTRGKPLPTLRYLRVIHWIMFCLFCSVGCYVLFRYFQSLRRFKKPYQGQSAIETLLFIVVASPILALSSGFVAFFFILIISTGAGQLLGWDLPFDFLVVFEGIIFFPFIECGWFWITNRLNDAIWHGALLVLAMLILGEWHFLTKLEVFF